MIDILKPKRFTLKREIGDISKCSLPSRATLGTLYYGEEEICKTLENPWLDNQNQISCIPTGIYKVIRDDTGRFQYWRLLDVKDRTGIEIHNGNKEKHTKGCILLGKDWAFMDGELAITASNSTLERLRDKKILPDKFELEVV